MPNCGSLLMSSGSLILSGSSNGDTVTMPKIIGIIITIASWKTIV